MTERNLQYCGPETRLQDAAKSMKRGNCGALPVIDKQNKVVGVVTDRDIALSLASDAATVAERNVGDIIAYDVVTVHPDDNLDEALRQMRVKKIGRLPVVDKEGKLKGIVSMHHLLTQSLDGKAEIGNLSGTGENLAKTLKALTGRYTLNSSKKTHLAAAGRKESWEESM